MMAELFEAVGFEITDEDSYNLLVEDVEFNGQRSRVERMDAALDGAVGSLATDSKSVGPIRHGAEVYYALPTRISKPLRPRCRSVGTDRVPGDGEAVVRARSTAGRI